MHEGPLLTSVAPSASSSHPAGACSLPPPCTDDADAERLEEGAAYMLGEAARLAGVSAATAVQPLRAVLLGGLGLRPGLRGLGGAAARPVCQRQRCASGLC